MASSSSLMKKFRAKERGVFIDELSRHGEVVSVYSKAMNVLHQDGLIASLVQSQDQMSALSIRSPFFSQSAGPEGFGVKPGNKVTFGAGRLI